MSAHAEGGGVDVFEPKPLGDRLQRPLLLGAGNGIEGQVVQRAEVEDHHVQHVQAGVLPYQPLQGPHPAQDVARVHHRQAEVVEGGVEEPRALIQGRPEPVVYPRSKKQAGGPADEKKTVIDDKVFR